MSKLIHIALIATLLTAVASAKDKQYLTGTVEREQVKIGWVDTTTCFGSPGSIHCGGGIRDEYAWVYWLTTADGTKHPLEHVAFTRDTLKRLEYQDEKADVRYRFERRKGWTTVEFIIIADPNGKEGSYVRRP